MQYSLYYEFIGYLYYPIWIICIYLIYKMAKAELLVFRLKYLRSPSKATFVGLRVFRILIIVSFIGACAFGSKWYGDYTKEIERTAYAELSKNWSPNRLYCVKKVAPYVKKDLVTEILFVPAFYAQCLEKTQKVPFKNFCGVVREQTEYRAVCFDRGLSRDQCNTLLEIAKEHCRSSA